MFNFGGGGGGGGIGYGGGGYGGVDYGSVYAVQEQQSQRAMQFMESQWADIQRLQRKNEPVQDAVVASAMDRMERYDKWAIADRQRYDQIYAPMEDAFAKQAMEYDTQARREAEAGKAEANIAQQFEQSRQAALDKLEKFGVDPSQARYGALDRQSRVAEAAAQAASGNQARTQVEQMGLALRQQAIQNGRNIIAQSMAQDQAAGAAGQQGVGTGIAGMGAFAQAAGTPGQWFTGAANQTNARGNLMAQQEQNQIQREKMQMEKEKEESGGFGDLIGMGTGLFSKFLTGGFGGGMKIAEGGAIPDQFSRPRYAFGGPVHGGPGMLAYDDGGDVRGGAGGIVPDELSPSAGAIPDDISAEISDGGQAMINAGEFVIPKDVSQWLGQKELQKLILKSRKEMGDPNAAPAQPEMGPEGGGPPGPNPMDLPPGMSPPPGAIPMPPGG
jgi:hypothetical protein